MFGSVRGKDTFDFQREFAAELFAADEHYDDVITETAGFVPLEVRFQKLIENGIRLQLDAKEFDSVDMRKMYLDDEFRVEPEDELEDIQVKLEKRAAFLAEFRAKQSEAQQKADSSIANKKTPEMKSQESASDSAPSDSE